MVNVLTSFISSTSPGSTRRNAHLAFFSSPTSSSLSTSPLFASSSSSSSLFHTSHFNGLNVCKFTGVTNTSCRRCITTTKREPRSLIRNNVLDNANLNADAKSETSQILQNVEVLRITPQWVAISKPAGVLMHRTKLYPSRRGEHFVDEYVRRLLRVKLSRDVKIFPIHRLDRPTTGVVLMGLDEPRHAAMLQEALQSSSTDTSSSSNTVKQYWTMAFNASQMPAESTWVNEHPLKDMNVKGTKNRKSKTNSKQRIQRSACTEFERLVTFQQNNSHTDDDSDTISDIAIIRATLKSTGRRHQIRRHLGNSRFPVVGDTSHGDTQQNHYAAHNYGVSRLCLHARRLSFTDPFTSEHVYLQAPVPEDLRQVVQRLPGYTPDLDAKLDLDDNIDC